MRDDSRHEWLPNALKAGIVVIDLTFCMLRQHAGSRSGLLGRALAAEQLAQHFRQVRIMRRHLAARCQVVDHMWQCLGQHIAKRLPPINQGVGSGEERKSTVRS